MRLLEKVRANAAAVRRAGIIAVEDARRAGVPAYYMDPASRRGHHP